MEGAAAPVQEGGRSHTLPGAVPGTLFDEPAGEGTWPPERAPEPVHISPAALQPPPAQQPAQPLLVMQDTPAAGMPKEDFPSDPGPSQAGESPPSPPATPLASAGAVAAAGPSRHGDPLSSSARPASHGWRTTLAVPDAGVAKPKRKAPAVRSSERVATEPALLLALLPDLQQMPEGRSEHRQMTRDCLFDAELMAELITRGTKNEPAEDDAASDCGEPAAHASEAQWRGPSKDSNALAKMMGIPADRSERLPGEPTGRQSPPPDSHRFGGEGQFANPVAPSSGSEDGQAFFISEGPIPSSFGGDDVGSGLAGTSTPQGAPASLFGDAVSGGDSGLGLDTGSPKGGANRRTSFTSTWRKSISKGQDGYTVNGEDSSFDDVVRIQKTLLQSQATRHNLFLPGSWYLVVWRGVITIAVLWAVCVTPLELAFSWWDAPAFFDAASQFVDWACILDMAVNFNSAKLEHGRIVYSRKLIAKSYMKSWFLIDLMTNLPWDKIMATKMGYSRKLGKIFKLPKLFRVIRLFRFAQEEAYYFGTLFSMGAILFFAHYISCAWSWLLIDCTGRHDSGSKPCPAIFPTYMEGLSVGMATIGGSDGWLRFGLETAIADSGIPVEGMGEEGGFTWSSFPPDGTAEAIAALTSMVGFCLLAMLFANVAHTLGKTGVHAITFHERLSNLKAASQQHSMPNDLFVRVRNHFHYVWSCGSDASRALLRDTALTVDLRRQLALCFYGHSLRQVPFLTDCEEGFLRQLCAQVEMECYSPMDHIITAGEMGTELYFLVVGRVRAELPDGTVLKIIHEGSFFGEMGMLFPGTSRTASVIAETFGWVLVVDRMALEDICTEELLDTFRSVAKERYEKAPTAYRASIHKMRSSVAATLAAQAAGKEEESSMTKVMSRRRSRGGGDGQDSASMTPRRSMSKKDPSDGGDSGTGSGPTKTSGTHGWVSCRGAGSGRSGHGGRSRLRTRHALDPSVLQGLESALNAMSHDFKELAQSQQSGVREIKYRLSQVEVQLMGSACGSKEGSLPTLQLTLPERTSFTQDMQQAQWVSFGQDRRSFGQDSQDGMQNAPSMMQDRASSFSRGNSGFQERPSVASQGYNNGYQDRDRPTYDGCTFQGTLSSPP